MGSSGGANNIKPKENLSKFENLKSVYILKMILDYLPKTKSLEFIKINKKIQKRLDMSIKDYKDYSELLTPIEIEIIPNKGCNFLNISKEEEGQYFHIYFDDNKKEIDRLSLEENETVNKINIIIDPEIKSFYRLFYISGFDSIKFKKFYRKNIEDMSYMLGRCTFLKKIDFSNFNTDNVTDMSGMFYKCSSIEELNLSNFNTNNVTNMNSMFIGCSSLSRINISNFNTNNVTDMSHMFNGCSLLKELNITNFNTNNVTNMNGMFSWCSSLIELNLANFNTNNVTNMSVMFNECKALKILDISSFNINNIQNKERMFYNCSNDLKKKIKEQIKDLKEEDF